VRSETNAGSSVWAGRVCGGALGACLFLAQVAGAQNQAPPKRTGTNVQTFIAGGVVQELNPAEKTITIAHDAIGSYMPAMTMPFKVQAAEALSGLQRGDAIRFRLCVTETESWIEDVQKTAAPAAGEAGGLAAASSVRETSEKTASSPPALSSSPDCSGTGIGEGKNSGASTRPRHPLLDFPFTNELGQRVRLADFRGQALAITFFYTRCPIPEFCPRLSKNFQQAALKLSALPSAPTNWHFLSVSFDTEFDTPAMLKAYAQGYQYDPKHWSFLTGPSEQIQELARLSDVTFSKENNLINHNFRTLVIDAAGHLQTVFPVSGDLSDALTTEMLKAAAITNRSS